MPIPVLWAVAVALLAQATPIDADPEAELAEYATGLRSLGEGPLLTSTPASGRAFRCTVLPARGDPATVRLVVAGQRGIVVSRRVEGRGAFTPGTLQDAVTATLDARALASLEARLDLTTLRAMPSNEALAGVRDGASWILEVASEGRHHAVVRRSPELSPGERGTGALVEACAALFRAAGFPSPTGATPPRRPPTAPR